MKRTPLSLLANRGEGSYRALSGADGRFAFSGVPAGEYRLECADPRSVMRVFGADGPLDRRRIAVSAETDLAGLTVQVSTPGVIRGRVSYEDGEPARVLVALWSMDGKAGSGVFDGVTNSRGSYELTADAPGAYYVVALPPTDWRFVALPPAPGQDPGQPPSGYAHSYYPGVSSIRSASAITVVDDSEVEGVDITLRPAPLVALHVAIINSGTGKPMSGEASISAVGAIGFIEDARELRSSPGADGAFAFQRVPAGSYYVRGRGEGWTIEEQLEVTPAPEQRSTLYYNPPRQIEGRLTKDAANAHARPNGLTWTYGGGGQEGLFVNEAGAFRASGSPGDRWSLSLHESEDPSLYIRSATLDGHAVWPAAFSLSAGIESARLEVVIASGAGQLTVEVTDGDDNSKVVVIPAAYEHLAARLNAEAGTDGRYRFLRVPPGAVSVLAWTGAPPCDFAVPGSCHGKGVSVEVQPGGIQNIRVPVSK